MYCYDKIVKALSSFAANLVIITTTDQIKHAHKTMYAPTLMLTNPGLKITNTPIKPINNALIRIK